MKKNKTIAFTCFDKNNVKFYENLKNSLAKFHPDLELRAYDEEKIADFKDPFFFYRQKPLIASQLFKAGYETVIGFDADQIVVSDLNHILEDTEDYDVGCVLNDTPLHVWDIETYYNCGLVVMKSKNFVEHWKALCMGPHFDHYQYREQDMLSILTSDYFPYKTKCYDYGDRLNGLVAKLGWTKFKMEDNKIVAETPSGKKQLSIVHFAGGNDPMKGNYGTRFQEDVVKYIDSLIQP